jgi:Ca2+-binding RTX toxin-like protein
MSRSIRRRTLLAAALPAVVAAVALPSAATASPHNFTFVRGAPDGTLQINATTGNSNLPAANNNVSVRVAGGSLRVVDSGDDVVADGSVCVKLSVHEASCQLSQIARIEASLDHDFEQGGDDAWRSATSLPTTVRGGDGKDTYIRGLSPFVSRVEFQGGTGTDEASYVLADRGVLVTKDERANDGRPGLDFDNVRSDVERLVGSAHGDSLNGNSGSVTEFFQGGLGNDLLFGNGGPDVFESSAAADGADKMTGGPGIDQVSYAGRTRPVNATLNFDGADDGEAGEGDELVGSNEVIVGGRAGDTIRAPAGSTAAHFLHGLGGIDTLEGADGPDEITGGARGDTLLGNGGDDRIFANDGEADVVGCGEGAADTAQLDNRDGFESCEIRPAVGTLRLAPRTVVAEAGEPVGCG